jgi:hypothetical protein
VIRFRFRDDEQRYGQLISEVYRSVAVHLPPEASQAVLRNLGKLQDLLWLEGIRQGVAAAAISNISKDAGEGNLEHLKAFQLHAHVYGSQDTPLRSIEEEWFQTLEASEPTQGSAWLDPTPMRFAPDTEQAFVAAQQAPATVPDRRERAEARLDRPPWPDDDFDAILDGEEDAQERPALLDRVRDALTGLAADGVKPRDWQDLILRLHMLLHVDAGFLDLQLGTPMGQTVLAQAGFFNLQPGAFGTDLGAIKQAAIDVLPPPGDEEE